jgi:hypothetical protein
LLLGFLLLVAGFIKGVEGDTGMMAARLVKGSPPLQQMVVVHQPYRQGKTVNVGGRTETKAKNSCSHLLA